MTESPGKQGLKKGKGYLEYRNHLFPISNKIGAKNSNQHLLTKRFRLRWSPPSERRVASLNFLTQSDSSWLYSTHPSLPNIPTHSEFSPRPKLGGTLRLPKAPKENHNPGSFPIYPLPLLHLWNYVPCKQMGYVSLTRLFKFLSLTQTSTSWCPNQAKVPESQSLILIHS